MLITLQVNTPASRYIWHPETGKEKLKIEIENFQNRDFQNGDCFVFCVGGGSPSRQGIEKPSNTPQVHLAPGKDAPAPAQSWKNDDA